jgi:NAD(P) transhydrogenase subunit alpha
MTGTLVTDLTVLVLSLLIGFEVISKVPSTLHTPLMSGANAIHGIVVVGAMLVAASADTALGYGLAFFAATFAAMNVVGGYVVTDRMLEMFRSRPADRTRPANRTATSHGQPTDNSRPRDSDPS